MNKLFSTFLLLTIAVFNAAAMTIDEIPNVHTADRTRFVSDPTSALTPTGLASADSILGSIWQSTSAEPVVVIVDNLDNIDADTYATQLFEKWGIGKKDKDNGLLMLLAMDDRKFVIRTGYGLEGVLPDITCGRILRNITKPYLQAGDTDNAVTESLNAIKSILTDPDNTQEIMSAFENDANARSQGPSFFSIYTKIGVVAAVLSFIYVLFVFFSTRKTERHERHERLQRLKMPLLMITIAWFGIPLLSFLLDLLLMRIVRRSVPKCPNCGNKMRLIDETHDNDYLTPAQDREEQLNSVDYDVWHCDNCSNNLIIPYVNPSARFTVCPNCGSRADILESNVIVKQPTTTSEGIGAKNYHCRNCGKRRQQAYRIAKIATPPIIIAGGGGGFGRGGGGGFSGGSFGGGMTGGGGASGGW